MEYIVLKEIKVSTNRCEYIFEYPDAMAYYIADTSQTLFVEVPAQYDLKDVPEALLTVPFVASVMCVSMLLGYGIKVPELDKTFYESIPNIRETFKKMFPYAEFCFEFETKRLVDCCYSPQNKTSVFFTGGLDATSALVEHLDEKPLMVNIYGGDLLLTDDDSHAALETYLKKISSQIGNEYVFIKSNCRRFFDERKIEKDCLNKVLKPEENHGWWASIAHIVDMTSVMAPVAYLKKIKKNYIGSSYSIGNARDANNPSMVYSIKYASMSFDVVDNNVGRSQKVEKIVQLGQKVEFELKVCWYAVSGKNCSRCEKCYRTILNILSKHRNPNDYGFCIDSLGYKRLKNFVYRNRLDPVIWGDIIQEFKKERSVWEKNKEMSWILDFDLNNPQRLALYGTYRKVRGLLGRVKRKIVG